SSDAGADATDGSTDAGADATDAGNEAGTQDDGGTDGTTDGTADAGIDGPVPSTDPPGVAHPPNEVIVFVANGTGIGGEAGRVADQLTAANYTAIAGNAASAAVEVSAIYYRPDYGEDAKLVAGVLQAPASLIQQMPADPGVSPDNQADADSAHVIVILGTDGLITG
ncbi:MAG: LytR C-terminal domain-containing protein, partial [Acidimicrobiia bacterium]|nr:LytR C-terminal domain-containing protein [Acidimicrobiia bacterium]